MENKINYSLLNNLSKEERYKKVLPQIYSLIEGENNLIANLANTISVLKYAFDYYLWIGFYFLDEMNNSELVVGPYQGKIACTRLKSGKGVCWAAVKKMKTILVDDVNKFPGHIACDSDSKSEIVVPLIKDNRILGVLDVDSDRKSAFDEIDKKYLEELINKIIYIF